MFAECYTSTMINTHLHSKTTQKGTLSVFMIFLYKQQGNRAHSWHACFMRLWCFGTRTMGPEATTPIWHTLSSILIPNCMIKMKALIWMITFNEVYISTFFPMSSKIVASQQYSIYFLSSRWLCKFPGSGCWKLGWKRRVRGLLINNTQP